MKQENKKSNNGKLQKLQQYLKLKPKRAVQILLQQNDLSGSFQFYNYLQETVKHNTTQLRTVLYKNHQNLFQCSDMIDKIQNFTGKIKQIQNQIDALLNEKYQQNNFHHNINHLNNPINKIEEFIIEKKYFQAFKFCNEYLKEHQIQNIQDSNISYLKYMKVQIIQNIQNQLKTSSLTKQLIEQCMNSLKIFMQITNYNQLQQIIQKDQNTITLQTENQSLLDLIYQFSVSQQQLQNYPLNDNEIIEVIFKYKLISLNCKQFIHTYQNQNQRVQSTYHKIFNFFEGLNKLLSISQKQQNNKSLSNIFFSNSKIIFKNISQIFIKDQRKSKNSLIYQNEQINPKENKAITISFQTELYEKVINSNEFMNVITILQQTLQQNSSQKINQQQKLINLFINLWKDYYQQLLQILIQKINPLRSFKISLNYIHDHNYAQLQRFNFTKYSQITKEKIQSYKQQFTCLINNFNQLINKSKYQQKNNIMSYFGSIIQKSKIQISQFLKLTLNQVKNNQKIQQKEIRQILIIYVLIQFYNINLNKILSKQNNINVSSLQLNRSLNQMNVNKNVLFIEIFDTQNKNDSQFQIIFKIINHYIENKMQRKLLFNVNSSPIQTWQHQMDYFFSLYAINVIQDNQLMDKLKKLILNIVKTKLQSIQ